MLQNFFRSRLVLVNFRRNFIKMDRFGDFKRSFVPEQSENTQLIRKAIQNLTLNEEDVEDLPEEWQNLYRMREERKLKMMRKFQVNRNDLAVKKIQNKLKLGERITAEEKELLEENGHKVSSIKSPLVDLNPLDLLTDIVNGDYTLQELHSIREGDEKAAEKDAVENSPLQFFDDVIENVKEKTHEALQTKKPGHFFRSLEAELTENMMPGSIADAIAHAATAIDLVHGNSLETNEAKAACESYVKALAMNEAEIKLKQIGELVNDKYDRQNTIELAEVAAAAGILSEMSFGQKTEFEVQPRKLSFDITELNYDIAFLPNDDPDAYKPLEIISYIGMTKKIS